jgi:hypothetical protein
VDNAVGLEILPRFPSVFGSFVPQPLDKESKLCSWRTLETFGHVVDDSFHVELTDVRGGHFLWVRDSRIIVKRSESSDVNMFDNMCRQIADSIVGSLGG